MLGSLRALLAVLCAHPLRTLAQPRLPGDVAPPHPSGLIRREQAAGPPEERGAAAAALDDGARRVEVHRRGAEELEEGGARSEVHASISDGGNSAEVSFQYDGAVQHFYMSSYSVYAPGAMVFEHGPKGEVELDWASARTFRSRDPGKWAYATISDSGTVSGVFEHGGQVLRVAPAGSEAAPSAQHLLTKFALEPHVEAKPKDHEDSQRAALPWVAEEFRLAGSCADQKIYDGGYVFLGLTASGAPYYQSVAGNTYMYWDPDCDAKGSKPMWILDTVRPDPIREKDLDGDGECRYGARVVSKESRPPIGPVIWVMYCGGQWANTELAIIEGGVYQPLLFVDKSPHGSGRFRIGDTAPLPTQEAGVSGLTGWRGTQWWPGCYKGDGVPHDLQVGIIADLAAYNVTPVGLGWRDDQSPARRLENLQRTIEMAVEQASYIFESQFHVRLQLGYVQVYSSADGAPDFAKSCEGKDALRRKLNDFRLSGMPVPFQGALHIFSGCRDEAISYAYHNTACRPNKGSGIGFNLAISRVTSTGRTAWRIFTHTLGHNLGAFDMPEGSQASRGLMDVGDGNLGSTYQYSTQYDRAPICAKLQDIVADGCQGKFSFDATAVPTP